MQKFKYIAIKKNSNCKVFSIDEIIYDISHYGDSNKELNEIINCTICDGEFIGEFFDIEITKISEYDCNKLLSFIETI